MCSSTPSKAARESVSSTREEPNGSGSLEFRPTHSTR